jgi:hypothetical protein
LYHSQESGTHNDAATITTRQQHAIHQPSSFFFFFLTLRINKKEFSSAQLSLSEGARRDSSFK